MQAAPAPLSSSANSGGGVFNVCIVGYGMAGRGFHAYLVGLVKRLRVYAVVARSPEAQHQVRRGRGWLLAVVVIVDDNDTKSKPYLPDEDFEEERYTTHEEIRSLSIQTVCQSKPKNQTKTKTKKTKTTTKVTE